MKYMMVYRCQGENILGDPCGWNTTEYSEIDAHEAEGPWHLVIGEMEAVDETSIP